MGDTTAPDTTIGSAKAGKVKAGKKAKKAKVTVAFTSTETATFTCSVDGGAYAPCVSPVTFKLKKGTHTIAVKATDAAGNVDATSATTTVKVKKKRK